MQKGAIGIIFSLFPEFFLETIRLISSFKIVIETSIRTPLNSNTFESLHRDPDRSKSRKKRFLTFFGNFQTHSFAKRLPDEAEVGCTNRI